MPLGHCQCKHHCFVYPFLHLRLFLFFPPVFIFGGKLLWIISTHFSFILVEASFKWKGLRSVNTLPFGTKPQSHSPVKGDLDKKIVSSSVPHLTTPRPTLSFLPLTLLNSPPVQFYFPHQKDFIFCLPGFTQCEAIMKTLPFWATHGSAFRNWERLRMVFFFR